mgnify:CR=1 FL=1
MLIHTVILIHTLIRMLIHTGNGLFLNDSEAKPRMRAMEMTSEIVTVLKDCEGVEKLHVAQRPFSSSSALPSSSSRTVTKLRDEVSTAATSSNNFDLAWEILQVNYIYEYNMYLYTHAHVHTCTYIYTYIHIHTFSPNL